MDVEYISMWILKKNDCIEDQACYKVGPNRERTYQVKTYLPNYM